MHSRQGLPSLTTALGSPRYGVQLLIGVCCLFFSASFASAAEIPLLSLHPHIDKGAYALQIDGKDLHSLNPDIPLIPASTLKILTSLMALETLGPEFRFTTYLYLDGEQNLYIKGEGDPFLTSEAVYAIADELKKHRVTTLNSIIFDESAFSLEGPPPQARGSDNPYDAVSAALAVNFNTVAFTVASDRKVTSAEKETPFLPIMKELAADYPPGSYRVNIGALADGKKHTNVVRLCGELFIAIFAERGITVKKGYSHGTVPPQVRLLFTHLSDKTVTELVRLCLKFSTNFIANQLFLCCGSRYYGFPATWDKAQKAGRQYLLDNLELQAKEVRMVDGSGLSTNNRISARAMLKILWRFRPYVDLLNTRKGVYIKSGTLTNVYTYVGYFRQQSKLSPFVIFLNQQKNTRKQILRLMSKEYAILTAGSS